MPCLLADFIPVQKVFTERKEDGFYSILEALRCGEKEEGERKEELTEGEDI